MKASDTFNALAAELTYTDLALLSKDGGLSIEDFVRLNTDLTPGQLLSFLSMIQTLLAPLTVEWKKVIYAVKGSSQNIPAAGGNPLAL